MKTLTLKFKNCTGEKTSTFKLKQKTLLSTKLEKLCKKHIVNKISNNSRIIDLPYQDEKIVAEIGLFGTKISRLYSRFVAIGQEDIIAGIREVQSFVGEINDEKNTAKSKIHIDVLSSNHHTKLKDILDNGDISKTFFYFVLPCENDLATMSLLSLAVSKLKEVLGKEFFVNVIVCTQEKNKLWKFCEENKIKTFAFPVDIDEKYCTLSPLGLFPLSVLGINLETLLKGAKQVLENFKQDDADKSLAFATAIILHNFYTQKNRSIELKIIENDLKDFAKHFETLLADFNLDFEDKVEMILKLSKTKNIKFPKLSTEFNLPKSNQELNNIKYLAHKTTLDEMDTPNFTLEIADNDDETVGGLLFYFELVALIIGELFGKNISSKAIKQKRENMASLIKLEKIKADDDESFQIKI